MRPSPEASVRGSAVSLAVLVAALGYFVDIFDLLLFALLRKRSLSDVLSRQLAELPAERHDAFLKDWGIWLDNTLQMTGLMVGGILWGVLGDRLGRIAVLFGSILTYSVANLLNAAITDVDPTGALGFMHALGIGTAIRQYEVLRFVAGVGLAGELGAGITLVAELTSRERRGVATTIVATVGILGAVAGYFITQWVSWRAAFAVGGCLGLALLALRVGVVESGMWSHIRTHQRRGAIWMLLWPPKRLARYLSVVLIAVPVWFGVGTLVKYGDVIGLSMGLSTDQKPDPGRAVMWCYVGLAIGDLASGLLSQLLRSRRGAVLVFHLITMGAMVAYFTLGARSQAWFYAVCLMVGVGCGYWAVFATAAAEQFGTNLRATAATTAPNVVRWSAAATAGLWVWLEGLMGGVAPASGVPWKAAAVAGAIVMAVALVGLVGLRETYGVDLDFEEH
jgi:MFS family permease